MEKSTTKALRRILETAKAAVAYNDPDGLLFHALHEASREVPNWVQEEGEGWFVGRIKGTWETDDGQELFAAYILHISHGNGKTVVELKAVSLLFRDRGWVIDDWGREVPVRPIVENLVAQSAT